MKADIHPQYGPATVHCGCGNSWETRSTKAELRVEICSVCHPFYTGEQRIVDTAGRVERFRQRYRMPKSGAEQPAATTDAEPAEAAEPATAEAPAE